MKAKFLASFAAMSMLASPTVAAACELDGMPGFHRYNPFAKVPGFQGLGPPAAPYEAQESTREAEQPKQDSKAEGVKKAKKPKKSKAIAPARAPVDTSDEAANDDWNPAEGLITLS